MMSNPAEILGIVIALIFAIVFHEVAHGLMARALGDRTAEEMNRLSLNPFRHVDPVGTVILPGLLALIHAPIFGWARPVPVNYARLRNPRFGMMLVAAAGPGTNFLMAIIAGVGLGVLMAPYQGVQMPSGAVAFIAGLLANFVLYNVFLGTFNLLPIPPFDGSHIVEGLLPSGPRQAYAKFRQVGMLLPILLLIVLPSLFPQLNLVGFIVRPVVIVVGAICPSCVPILSAD